MHRPAHGHHQPQPGHGRHLAGAGTGAARCVRPWHHLHCIWDDGAQVAFPAAFPTVIAVTAVGRFGTFPQDSAHALTVSRTRDRRGGIFAASFSDTGPQVSCCAPGVAVLSTVPSGFAAWDGTSQACPWSARPPRSRSVHPSAPATLTSPRMCVGSCAVRLTTWGCPAKVQGCGLPGRSPWPGLRRRRSGSGTRPRLLSAGPRVIGD